MIPLDPDFVDAALRAVGVGLVVAGVVLLGLRPRTPKAAGRVAAPPVRPRSAPAPAGGPGGSGAGAEGGARLRVDDGPMSGTRFAIGDAGLRIGRDPATCEVVLGEPTVSREHALIERRAGILRLTHLSGTNPTWVNERPVREARLAHGDAVRIGGVRFTVEDAGGG